MKKILVIYHSQEYGNTEACAKLVARGAQEVSGVEVKLINTNVMQRVDMSELAACDGVAFGSPDYGSYVAGTIKQIFDDIYVANKSGLAIASKPCVLFMTHGGGGKGIEPFKSMTRRFILVADPFTCQGAPEKECVGALDLGRKLAQAVLK